MENWEDVFCHHQARIKEKSFGIPCIFNMICFGAGSEWARILDAFEW